MAAVVCPALASGLARATPPTPQPLPKRPVAPAKIMPPPGLPRVEFRQVGDVIEIHLSNPHDRTIFFECMTIILVVGGRIQLHTRVRGFDLDSDFFLYANVFHHAGPAVTVRLLVGSSVADQAAILADPNVDVAVHMSGTYCIGQADEREPWLRYASRT